MESLLFQAVLKCLRALFPDAVIATETVRQGWKAPAFFVRQEEFSAKQEMGNRFRAKGVYALEAYPPEADALEAAKMLGRLQEGFSGENGLCIREERIGPDGKILANICASAWGFRVENPPEIMGKMKFSLRLGAEQKG